MQLTKENKQFTNLPKKEHIRVRKTLLSTGTRKRLKRGGIALTIVLGLTAGFLTFIAVSSFYDKFAFRFQTPVIVQSPVIMYERKQVIEAEVAQKVKILTPTSVPTPTPAPTEKPRYINFNLVPKVYAEQFEKNPSHPGEAAIINSQKHAAVIWRIYMLESTFGRNDECSDKGMVNGFGFAIHSTNNRCYSSFKEVVADVNAWIDDKYSAGWNLGTLLCYYNRGLKIDTCDYAKNFLAIN